MIWDKLMLVFKGYSVNFFLMKKALLTLALFTTLISCGQKNDSSPLGSLSSAPMYKLDGNKTTIQQLKGKKGTLIAIWATWCGPCIKEIPTLIALSKKYKDQGFNVLSINVDEIDYDQLETLQKFSQSQGINYPVVWADQTMQARLGGIAALPTSLFIDKDGLVLEKLEGLYPHSMLEARIEKYMAL